MISMFFHWTTLGPCHSSPGPSPQRRDASTSPEIDWTKCSNCSKSKRTPATLFVGLGFPPSLSIPGSWKPQVLSSEVMQVHNKRNTSGLDPSRTSSPSSSSKFSPGLQFTLSDSRQVPGTAFLHDQGGVPQDMTLASSYRSPFAPNLSAYDSRSKPIHRQSNPSTYPPFLKLETALNGRGGTCLRHPSPL